MNKLIALIVLLAVSCFAAPPPPAPYVTTLSVDRTGNVLNTNSTFMFPYTNLFGYSIKAATINSNKFDIGTSNALRDALSGRAIISLSGAKITSYTLGTNALTTEAYRIFTSGSNISGTIEMANTAHKLVPLDAGTTNTLITDFAGQPILVWNDGTQQLTFNTLIVANGEGITNINGANIQPNTIPSSAIGMLDVTNLPSSVPTTNWVTDYIDSYPKPLESVAGPGITITTNAGKYVISLYAAPTISGFVNDVGMLEIGNVVLSTILNWSLGGSTITSQSLNVIGALSISARTYTDTTTYSSDRTYTLTTSDGTSTVSSSTGVYFRHRRYWGASNSNVLSSEDIRALTYEFASSRVKSEFLVPTANQYFVYAYPASWGATSFKVGSLPNTDFVLTVQNFTNSSENVTSFNVYTSPVKITGDYRYIAE